MPCSRGTETWWSSAVKRNRFSFRATSRTPSKPLDALMQLWVCDAVVCSMFSLIGRLPPPPSASDFPPLFGHFVGTVRPSDSPTTFMLDFWLMAFSSRPAYFHFSGDDGASRFSRVEFPCMPGFSDCAESCECSRFRIRQVLPSACLDGVGTLRAIISQLDIPPTCAPVNASHPASRLTTHDSGSGWFARPFLCGSCIHDSSPVYPGAPKHLFGPRRP